VALDELKCFPQHVLALMVFPIYVQCSSSSSSGNFSCKQHFHEMAICL